MFDPITSLSLNSHSPVSDSKDLSLLNRNYLELTDPILPSAKSQEFWFPQHEDIANSAELIQRDIKRPSVMYSTTDSDPQPWNPNFNPVDDLTGLEPSESISSEFFLSALPTVNLSATDATAAEVLTGQKANPGRFTLTRAGNLSNSLTVNYTIGGTATNGIDYKNLKRAVTFAANSATARININVLDDTVFEGNETVTLTVANSANYTVGTNNTATVTITDNDINLPAVTIAATDATAAEVLTGQTANPGRFTLTRTGNLTNSLTVNYTIGGTATNGADYGSLTGAVTFAANSATAVINVNVLDDTLFEGNETVILTLANNANYIVGTGNTATVTIADNDNPPTTGGTAQWTRQYSYQPSLFETATDLVTAADGSIYAIGWMKTSTTEGGNGTDDAWVAKYDSLGQQLWFRLISKPSHFSRSGGTTYVGVFDERAYGIALDSSGNVFVTGTSVIRGTISQENDPSTPDDNTSEYFEGTDLFIYKYSSSGALLTELSQFTGNNNESARDIAIDGAGNVYLVGKFNNQAALFKYDGSNFSTGNWLWAKALSSDEKDNPNNVAVDNQGFVYVAGDYDRPFNNGTSGSFANVNGEYDAWLVKHRTSDGELVWVKTDLKNTANFDDRVTSMVVANNGRIYITGITATGEFSGQSTFKDTWLLQYESINVNGVDQGNRRSALSFAKTSSLEYFFTDVAVDSNNGVYVTGYRATNDAVQAIVIKYDGSQNLTSPLAFQWEGRIGTPGNSAIPFAVTVAQNGSVYMLGQTGGNLARPVTGQFDIFLTQFTNNIAPTALGIFDGNQIFSTALSSISPYRPYRNITSIRNGQPTDILPQLQLQVLDQDSRLGQQGLLTFSEIFRGYL